MGVVLNLQAHSDANTEKLVVCNVMLIKTENICIECIWKLPYPPVPTLILYEPKAFWPFLPFLQSFQLLSLKDVICATDSLRSTHADISIVEDQREGVGEAVLCYRPSHGLNVGG